ncbi:MAG: transketolase [Planctomycetota bacterium]
MGTPDLEALCREIRGQLVANSCRAHSAHLGSSLSCVEILVAAYWGILKIDPSQPAQPGRDRFILSKGHAASALYCVLAQRGFFPVPLLQEYGKAGGCLPEHPGPGCIAGVEAATGSLGHGLSLGLGMALASRILRQPFRVLVVISDGECNEGSTWEAAMMAPRHKLGNLCVVVDYNKWQATGRSNEVLELAPLRDKWAAFGWDAEEVDGHDLQALLAALGKVTADKPRALVAHTVKGKGISFMEDDNNWHYRIPTQAEVQTAHRELGLL